MPMRNGGSAGRPRGSDLVVAEDIDALMPGHGRGAKILEGRRPRQWQQGFHLRRSGGNVWSVGITPKAASSAGSHRLAASAAMPRDGVRSTHRTRPARSNRIDMVHVYCRARRRSLRRGRFGPQTCRGTDNNLAIGGN